jgi:uncharacterized membrane protein YfcA
VVQGSTINVPKLQWKKERTPDIFKCRMNKLATDRGVPVVEVPVRIKASEVHWKVIGGGEDALKQTRLLVDYETNISLSVIAEKISADISTLKKKHPRLKLIERTYETADLNNGLVIIATGNQHLDRKIQLEARQLNTMVYLPSHIQESDFVLTEKQTSLSNRSNWYQRNTDLPWKKLVSGLVIVFVLMVLGHIIISSLPLPSFRELWKDAGAYFDYHCLFFVLAGFLAQMVDGMLSMGYGVTSATCLMSMGVNPVSVSAAIHTSEIFTTGISGYSHYRFGNVNKKLFRHLVVPGVIGAVLGALMLVYLGERYSNYLMPVIALYAGFLGLKILVKAFRVQPKAKKAKRIGWLAGAGGFFDSFGGGGWGPIVTSNLISKGRSPRYTVGSVSLTEFFVTLSSAFTFFITIGVTHWNVVLGLIVGGVIAAPIAARLAGRLPRKTMMILVGIMVMAWCLWMIIKTIF